MSVSIWDELKNCGMNKSYTDWYKDLKMVKRLHNRVKPTKSLFSMDKEMKRIRRKGNRICRLINDSKVDVSSKAWQDEVDSYCNAVNAYQRKIAELYGLKNF